MLVYKNHSPHLIMGGALLTMLAGVSASHTQLQEAAKKQADRAVTVRIIDETEPLCRAALPNHNLLHFVASPAGGYQGNASNDNLWAVDCLDDKNNLLLHLLWNADSKRALVFSRAYSRPAWKSRTPASIPLSTAKAVFLARTWACRLSPASHADTQSVVSRLQRDESIVRVRLRLADGEAIIWLNAWTGEITSGLTQEAASQKIRTPGDAKQAEPKDS